MTDARLCSHEKTTRSQGEANRQEIIDFLKLNNRWYSAEDLFQILNINIGSLRTHLNNLVNQDIVLSTFFYKHYSDGRPVRRKITHYKHRDHLSGSEISNGNANKCSS